MKLFKRSIATLMVLMLVVSVLTLGISADTQTRDGLTVTLTTDKESYNAGEDIKATLTVTNNNETAMETVTLKQLIPEGYELAEGQESEKTVNGLNAGDTVTLTVRLVAVTEAEDDSFNLMEFYREHKTLVHIAGIVLGVILLAVLVALGIQKLRYSFLSMLLCAGILLGAVSGTVVQAQALAPIEGSIKVSAAFTADGKEVTLEGTADYSMEPEETPEAVCTVTFETKGGSAVEPQQVDNGGLAVRPDVPTREGHVFVGWFADEACENAFDFTAPITKSCTVYAYWINTEDETDTDGDGLTDELEKFFGTDKEKVDTDGDGLSDYIEVLEIGTDPLLKDTDGDGILDPDEDTDTDGLTDKAEIDLGTDILSMDTDGDGLLDGEEINTHKTDPLKEDTDEDGANDKWEIDNGFNALEFNESFETVSLAAASEVAVSVVLNLPGDQAETLTVTPVLDNPYLTNQIPGYIDVPFDFSVENEFEGTATISFEFDKNLLADETFVPTVYYFNEELMMLEELVTVIDPETGIASTEVEHFSTYILLNKTDFDTVWNSEIKPPDIENSQMTGLDIVFVIDSSGSMSWNDPSGIRKSAAKQFVDKMGEHDRAAIVDLDSSASLLIGFTNVKIDLNGKIDRINDSGGTSIGRAVNLAIQQFTNTSYTRTDAFKYIILLTDGQGDYNNQYTQNAADNDIVIYTIGLGSDVDENLLKNIADATKGKYFFATQADMLGEIFDFVAEETIDYQKDSNEDGISDYFTKILCEGKPYVNGALNPFHGLDYEEVQKDENADYDKDGLLNGEEFKMKESGGKVYAVMTSNPTKADSDDDGYSDYDEVNKYKSNPMEKNLSFLQTEEEKINGIDGQGYHFIVTDSCVWYNSEYYNYIVNWEEPWWNLASKSKIDANVLSEGTKAISHILLLTPDDAMLFAMNYYDKTSERAFQISYEYISSLYKSIKIDSMNIDKIMNEATSLFFKTMLDTYDLETASIDPSSYVFKLVKTIIFKAMELNKFVDVVDKIVDFEVFIANISSQIINDSKWNEVIIENAKKGYGTTIPFYYDKWTKSFCCCVYEFDRGGYRWAPDSIIYTFDSPIINKKTHGDKRFTGYLSYDIDDIEKCQREISGKKYKIEPVPGHFN